MKFHQLKKYYFDLENKKNITLVDIIWNTFIFFLSFFSIFIVSVELFFDIPGDLLKMYLLVDFLICLILLAEFFVRLALSKHKLFYLYTHFFDFVGAIPLDFFRYGRLFRIFLFFRFYRSMRKNHKIRNLLKSERSISMMTLEAFLFIFLTTIFMILTFSFLILIFESRHAGANIKTPVDAFWWAWVTISTVGYGDYYPVTMQGKVAASFLILFGIGLFSSFTVLVSTILFSFADFKATGKKEEALKKKLDRMEKILEDLLEKKKIERGNRKRK